MTTFASSMAVQVLVALGFDQVEEGGRGKAGFGARLEITDKAIRALTDAKAKNKKLVVEDDCTVKFE
jgi:hypothetical protein